MPKYLNTSNKNLYLTRDGLLVKPNTKTTTKHYYDDTKELKLESIEPYQQIVEYSSIDEIEKDEKKRYYIFNATKVVIIPIDSDIKIYFHEDKDNSDNVLYVLKENKIEIINNSKLFRDIYIEPVMETNNDSSTNNSSTGAPETTNTSNDTTSTNQNKNNKNTDNSGEEPAVIPTSPKTSTNKTTTNSNSSNSGNNPLSNQSGAPQSDTSSDTSNTSENKNKTSENPKAKVYVTILKTSEIKI